MTENTPNLKVAVVQAAPVLFDREATVEKACRLTQEAAAQGAKVILFPEAFIPAYPRGLTFGTVVGSRTPQGRETWQATGTTPSRCPRPATAALGEAARQAQAYLAIGVIERDTAYSRRHAVLHAALLRPAGRAARQAPQAQAHRRRAPDLGRGGRQHADRRRYAPTGASAG